MKHIFSLGKLQRRGIALRGEKQLKRRKGGKKTPFPLLRCRKRREEMGQFGAGV